jgi:hypothetical protein
MKNKIIAAALLLSVTIFSAGCAAQKGQNQTEEAKKYTTELTAEQKQEDLDYLYDTISKKHKNLFFKTSEETYKKKKAELESKLSSMSDVEFYYAIQEFAALAGDGHTNADIDDNRVSRYSFKKGLPFAVAKFDGLWRLLLCEESYKDYLGMVVTAINGVSMEEVYDRAAVLISHETDAWLDSKFSNTINFIDALNYLGISDGMDSISLTLTKEDGTTIEQEFNALSEDEMFSASIIRYEAPVPITGNDGSYYRFLALDSDTLFIQYNTCQEDEALSMKKFTAQVKKELENGAYKKIIVDLRYNTGGNSEILNPLTNLLEKQVKKENTELFTLIGDSTFSSGIFNAIDLQRIGAVLVGTPTGGAVNSYGELGIGSLPNMPVLFSYSTKYFELIPDYQGSSLEPDILVEQSFENYRNGIDNEINYILNP